MLANNLNPKLYELQHWAKNQLNTDFSFTWFFMGPNDKRIQFSCFQNKGRKGNGSIVLKKLCALADELELPIVLWTSYDKLVDYYINHGFLIVPHPDPQCRVNNYIRQMSRPIGGR